VDARRALTRRGFLLEWCTLGWNVVGVVVLGVAAAASGSIALLGFGLDSLIEIGASAVVLWELSGTGEARRRIALRLIGVAFLLLACYLVVQSGVALATGRQSHGAAVGGIAWTAVTAVVMFLLAAGKRRTGLALENPVLLTEGRVTLVDGLLAVAVLIGVAADALLGWVWADPLAALVLAAYAGREAVLLLRG
jgi:divalent metal cation (Fe/Co/Zn/Cd) transporter